MKANCSKRLRLDDKAQVGIGTMIIFIATVLVAAVASAVLLDTGAKLQERSSRTGNEVSKEVAGNLKVVLVQGGRTDANQVNVTSLNITISLSAGASPSDLGQLAIQLKSNDALKTLTFVDGPSGLLTFNATELRDADNSFKPGKPVMNAGDLISVNIDLTANVAELPTRTEMGLMLMPEVGHPVRGDFLSPESYGDDLVIQLR